MFDEQKLARIRWHCRRGMLELDLILLPFFEQHFLTLSAQQQQQFIDLLEATDPELFAWLMGHEQPEQQEWIYLIQLIRKTREH